MKSLREYIELVNEAGPMTAAVNQQVDLGRQTKAPGAPQHPLEIGATRAPAAPTPAAPTKLDPATFPQGTAQPSGDPMGFKSAAATDPLKATFPATQGIATPQAGSPTAPVAKTASKSSFKDLGKQFGYDNPADVKKIQQQLSTMGYPIAIDGKFGPKTLAAYRQAYSQMYGQQPGQTDPNQPVPQNYQQGQAAKQDLSKDMAAATGTPNPYATAAPSSEKQALLAKAAELTKAGDAARAKIYTDAASRMNESTELTDILRLAKVNKI